MKAHAHAYIWKHIAMHTDSKKKPICMFQKLCIHPTKTPVFIGHGGNGSALRRRRHSNEALNSCQKNPVHILLRASFLYIYIYIYMYAYINIFIHVFMYIDLCVYIHTYIWTRICMYVQSTFSCSLSVNKLFFLDYLLLQQFLMLPQRVVLKTNLLTGREQTNIDWTYINIWMHMYIYM